MAKIVNGCSTTPVEHDLKTNTGLSPKVAAILTYLLGWVTGLFFLIVERDNEFIRYHAIQSIAIFGSVTAVAVALGFVPVAGWILDAVLGFVAFTFWIVLMLRALMQCSRLASSCCYSY
jgi:uncharacterized membrane protein